jgi:hypothetical protein
MGPAAGRRAKGAASKTSSPTDWIDAEIDIGCLGQQCDKQRRIGAIQSRARR